MNGDLTPAQKQLVRAKQAWARRDVWSPWIEDAYSYCLPHRRSNQSGAKLNNERIFDMTASMAVVFSAGNLKNDMFPTGQSKIELEPGPIIKSRLPVNEVRSFERMLSKTGDQIDPFFNQGGFDTAMEETFQDVMIGTGAIMPVRGNHNDPVFFANIPIDNFAPMGDAWGRFNFGSWKQKFTYQQIKEGWPDGKYDKNFSENLKAKPDTEVDLYQDFFKLKDGRWQYVAYTEKSDDFIVRDVTNAQPIAPIRYSAGGGEMMGRGPVLMAMPTIKTLNKAQEMALRSAAMQMLGIWGYRAGGTFNPATVSRGAGSFWPMQSTGGVLGPDVQRLDVASGRMDVAQMVIGGMREDLKQALFGDQLPSDQGTPKSAQEILARMQRQGQNNRVAAGRISRETMPVLVPRVAEILHGYGYLKTPLSINDLTVNIKVRSPMQQAIDAGQLQNNFTYLDLVNAVAGENAIDEHIEADELLNDARKVLDIPVKNVPSAAKRQQIRQDKKQAEQDMMAIQLAMEADKNAEPQQQGVAA